MKKITSCLLLISIIIIPMLFVNATDEYECVDYNPIVMPKDIFKSLFSADKIEKISYNCNIFPVEANQTANVALDIDLLIDGKHYNIVSQGEIDIYTLSDNDILYEGPIDGVINVNDNDYKVIAGITSLKSTGEKRISLTIQDNKSVFISISFGDNVIKGKVLDHFNERLGNSNVLQSDDNQEIHENESDDANINSISPDFSVKIAPELGGSGESGDRDDNAGYFDLGKNGQWKFQSKSVAVFPDVLYTALQSRTYFDVSRNILMVTVRPYCQKSEEYYLSVGYDYASVTLLSFGAKVQLASDAPAESHAYIAGIAYPEKTLEEYGSCLNNTNIYLSALFKDILNLIGIPTSLIDSILQETNGIVTGNHSAYSTDILVKRSTFSSHNFDDLEDITSGLPFEFLLTINRLSTYVGDTEYTLKVSAKYMVSANIITATGKRLTDIFYPEAVTTHTGKVTLGK